MSAAGGPPVEGGELTNLPDVWTWLYASHDAGHEAGRLAERADVIAALQQHRAVLARNTFTASEVLERRRIDELIASIAAGLHVGQEGGQ